MLVRMGLWRSGGGLEEGKLGEVEEEKEKGQKGIGEGEKGMGDGMWEGRRRIEEG